MLPRFLPFYLAKRKKKSSLLALHPKWGGQCRFHDHVGEAQKRNYYRWDILSSRGSSKIRMIPGTVLASGVTFHQFCFKIRKKKNHSWIILFCHFISQQSWRCSVIISHCYQMLKACLCRTPSSAALYVLSHFILMTMTQGRYHPLPFCR